MTGKGSKRAKKSMNRAGNSEISVAASPRMENDVLSTPFGTEMLQTMATEVVEFNAQVNTRYTQLVKYVDGLERLNEKLEGRVDRSLAIAEVRKLECDPPSLRRKTISVLPTMAI